MTAGTLVARSLVFHWRSHLGTFLGAALCTAVLVGALAVGDSVRFSLRGMALARLGGVHLALHAQSRFFREKLASDLAQDLKAPVASIILLPGTAVSQADGGDGLRTGHVQVIGVSSEFWSMAPGAARAIAQHPTPNADSVALNRRLADRLKLRVGDEVLLRVEKPSLLSRDAPLSTVDDATVALRLSVTAVVDDDQFGRFSLEANQVPPYNAFVSLDHLQRKIEQVGRANVLLVGSGSGAPPTLASAGAALSRQWQLADASLELRDLPSREALELRTDRVFIDASVASAATGAMPGARGVLTYFVNELSAGGRSTPYSTVAALEAPPGYPDLQDGEIVINRWLADDLGTQPGQELRITYFVVGRLRGLTKQTRSFRIRGVVPMTGEALDRDLMPRYPGVAGAKNCRDWEPGIPIDLKRIRDRDETYWDAYGGTPKAFITLPAGQSMWSNRFGSLTAVRYTRGAASRADVEARIRDSLDPASIGLFFMPVRQQAVAASSQSLDFGALFLGFSMFLIVASLLLTGLLFAFAVEQRAEEVGTLLALGFSPRLVRSLLLLEGAALAAAAGLVGAPVGLLYTSAVVEGLTTVWRGAVANSALRFHAEPATLAVGTLAGFVVSLVTIWLVVRKQAVAPARELLASGAESSTRLLGRAGTRGHPWAGVAAAVVTASGAAALTAAGLTAGHEHAAAWFFGAGTLLLAAGVAATRVLLGHVERGGGGGTLTVNMLGVRNSVRRMGRSLTVVGLLACGAFMVIAVGASRHDPLADVERRSSGTGGFSLYGESTLPVYQDLNTSEGQDAFGIAPDEVSGTRIIAMRVRDGDDASCLNLNKAQQPRILGVDPAPLSRSGAFSFAQAAGGARDGWALLERRDPDGVVPAVGDTNTVVWSLGKSLGDVVPIVDDRGGVVQLRIVGILANSVLQGSLIVSEAAFIQRFHGESGYRAFLIDAGPEPGPVPAAASQALTSALEDVGLALTPAGERLADFAAVENTYLSIFAVLGGLGLLLGSLGLGVVVLRHVLERRAELALLSAVGFRRRALQSLVFSEHVLLLVSGLAVGAISALLAVLPALRSPGANVPWGSLAVILLVVLLGGGIWTLAAAAFACRGTLINALRND